MSQIGKYSSLNAPMETLTTDDAVVVSPVAGNINLVGGTNINTTGAGNSATVNLDNSISLSGTIDAVGDITSSAGDIEATLGNLLAPAGQLSVGLTVNAVGNITSSGGDIVSTTGAGSFATSVTVGNALHVLAGGADIVGDVDVTGDVTLSGVLQISALSTGFLRTDASGDVLSLSDGNDGQLLIGATGSLPAWANITTPSEYIDIANGANTIALDMTSNAADTAFDTWNGAFLNQVRGSISSDGTTITLSVDKAGGGDLTIRFSDGYYDWDTTPAATVTLTPGTDTVPVVNYVYMLQSTKTLTVSTSGWPSAEHAKIGRTLLPSAALVQTDGAYMLHRQSDETWESGEDGHILHITDWVRSQNATWISGVAQTLTITVNGGSKDNVIFTSTAGVVKQLHDTDFPAFTGTPDLYVVNDSVTPYTKITDINAIDTDSSGGSLVNKYFTLVIWGASSGNGTSEKLYINLPSGGYNSANYAKKDARKKANYSIPSEFKGSGFLIAAYVLHYDSAASGTWTNEQFTDLRGLYPSITAGGSTDYPSEFDDSEFRINDDSDPTKQLAFDISGVTTATTRTITMDDRDIDLDAVPDTFATGSGSATPAAGSLTISGTANEIETSGAGSTVTIGLPNAVTIDTLTLTNALTVSQGGSGATTLTDHGVLLGSGTSAITATSALTDGQLLIGNTGSDPSLATITEGTNIDVTNGSGSIEIETTKVEINEQTGTTYTLVLTDRGKLVTLNNASAITLTVPPNSSVAFATGTVITISQLGAGTVTVAAGTGVTINSLDSNLDLSGQYAAAALHKTGTDTWLLVGSLA